MTEPEKNALRHRIYMVTTRNNVAGVYVGETPTHVVLRIGDGAQGFPWTEVEPVVLHPTLGASED